jgi:hypothetical protein
MNIKRKRKKKKMSKKEKSELQKRNTVFDPNGFKPRTVRGKNSRSTLGT